MQYIEFMLIIESITILKFIDFRCEHWCSFHQRTTNTQTQRTFQHAFVSSVRPYAAALRYHVCPLKWTSAFGHFSCATCIYSSRGDKLTILMIDAYICCVNATTGIVNDVYCDHSANATLKFSISINRPPAEGKM